jgi:hypothetical protein
MQPQEKHAMQRLIRLGVAAAVAALLAACGGGGGADPVPPPAMPADAVPDSATASVRAYTEFTGQLIADDTAAAAGVPLRLPLARAPTSETDRPMVIR